MKENNKRIKSGVYLVIDPFMEESIILEKLQIILTKQIAAVQVWDNFAPGQNAVELIEKIQSLCAKNNTPVLVNNRWEYLEATKLDGVHFDEIPADLDYIRTKINRDILVGLTCGNDLDAVKWAAEHHVDYISFCSMFPSSSAATCEIVSYESVKKAAKIFDKPLFLAGGIYPGNIKQLKDLEYDGIAVISGIMNSENPDVAVDQYYENINLKK